VENIGLKDLIAGADDIRNIETFAGGLLDDVSHVGHPLVDEWIITYLGRAVNQIFITNR
jgi:hypothetical protein